MYKLALGLGSGKYSEKKLADKTVSDEMTDEERVVAMKDQYYQDGIKPQLFKTLIGKGHQDFQTG